MPATAVTAVPADVDVQHAAVIGLAGVAAHGALQALDVQAGETVLVSGATVIGTAQPGQEDEYIRGLGAAHTVDYTADIPAAVRAIASQGVDKVLHAAGDAAALGSILKARGTLASTRGASADEVGREDVTVAAIMAAATADKLATLLDHAAKGKIRVNVETGIPLERAREAFAAFAGGTPRQGPHHPLAVRRGADPCRGPRRVCDATREFERVQAGCAVTDDDGP